MQYVGLGLHWNDLEVGQKFRTINRTITEADLSLIHISEPTRP